MKWCLSTDRPKGTHNDGQSSKGVGTASLRRKVGRELSGSANGLICLCNTLESAEARNAGAVKWPGELNTARQVVIGTFVEETDRPGSRGPGNLPKPPRASRTRDSPGPVRRRLRGCGAGLPRYWICYPVPSRVVGRLGCPTCYAAAVYVKRGRRDSNPQPLDRQSSTLTN
jgi:hypothetical protein